MEPFEVEDDPPEKTRPRRRWINQCIVALLVIPLLGSALTLVVAFKLCGHTLSPFLLEMRADVITYSDSIDAGSTTAVEWRFSMPAAETMVDVARDGSLGSTSTAFVTRKDGNDWDVMFYSNGGVRYFYSGHSIQGAAYTMYHAFDENPTKPIVLHTPGLRPIIATMDDEDGKVSQEIDTEDGVKFVCRPLEEVVRRLVGDVDQIGQFRQDVLDSLLISSKSLANEAEGNMWVFHLGIVVLVNSEETLRNLSPRFDKMMELELPGDTKEGLSYNPGAAFTHTRNVMVAVLFGPDKPVNFKYRFFCPRLGINEDPVTGTGMAAMITLYSAIRHQIHKQYKGEQASYSPGFMEGFWAPTIKNGIIKYKGGGIIRSLHSLPMKYKAGQPY